MGLHGGSDTLSGGKGHRVLVHHRSRGLLAAADAGSGDHAHIRAAQNGRQARQQVFGSGQLAAQAVANPHCYGGRLRITAQHLKVVVESGHLKHLGHANAQSLGQRHQVAVVQAAEVVVQAVQVLDEHVAGKRPLA